MLFAVCAGLTKEGRRTLALEKGRISRSGNMKRKGTIVALTIQIGQDAVASHNEAMQLWIGMKNVGAD